MPRTSTEAASRREQRRLQHQDLSRTQLLDAAEEVFGRKGFHEATLKEVADLAEFSVGSVYSFFESKDDLFRQIFVRRGEEFMTEIRQLLGGGREGPAVDQLHDLVDFEVGWFRTHARFARLYLRYSSAAMLSSDRDADAVIADNYDEAMALQAALFDRGRRAGVLRGGDPAVLSRLFTGLISAYQAMDPAVVDDDTDAERLALSELHAIVDAAFVRRP
jgi:TetR/AcrR family transcriptional regulator